MTRRSERIEVTGIVQGVGFRPFVHRLAMAVGVDGQVGNDSSQVVIEASGTPGALETFTRRLRADAPPLARIESITRIPVAVVGTSGFRIAQSRTVPGGRTLVPPDTAVCVDCRRQLFDPADRRFRHPFITCTDCGPRFTIIESLPYDRPNTTMADYPLCEACDAEYRDPSDRRYHAQPIACHDCGPRLTFDGADEPDPVSRAAAAVAAGRIVAVKGLGGYHLACDATRAAAVAELRTRKQRADKPFAVMVADLDQVAAVAELGDAEAELLCSPAAPIVLLRARPDSPLSALVAPGNPLIGVVLPYTPIQHLLFERHRTPLVMTSANRAGEPIAHRDDQLAPLGDLFDHVLGHGRRIHVPCDDSVVRLVDDRLLPIRRSRGYTPIPVHLNAPRRSVLAVGGELKNTFCVTRGDHAWVSQHIGDMQNLETVRAFESSVESFVDLYQVVPDVVAADGHPGYGSSRWARRTHRDLVEEVQHHHAHIGAVMAEHQVDPTQEVLGFAFDGTGYGDDGTIWGGELLLADAERFERIAHLAPVPLPGGDAAIRHPGRVALAHLYAAGIEWSDEVASVQCLDIAGRRLLRQQLERGVACVPTTSMGRLFDAVASLVGLRHEVSYEAQAAIDLEIAAECSPDLTGGYRFDLLGELIVPKPVLEAVLADRAGGVDTPSICRRFHDAVTDVVRRLARRHRSDSGIVALSGGVFQNALLTRRCVADLEADGFRVLTHTIVPPNDGGLALGQAYIAAHRRSVAASRKDC